MTVEDYIKWANKEIDKNESNIQAADGLPGLYYDAEEVKGYEKNIQHYNQLIEYLKDYKKLKKSIRDIKKEVKGAAKAIKAGYVSYETIIDIIDKHLGR